MCSYPHPMQKHMIKSLIFGCTGQDGSYLSELLLSKDYKVYGVKRHASTVFNTNRVDHLHSHSNFYLEYGDVTDFSSVLGLISKIRPDYIFNLAAMSHVAVSFRVPLYTAQCDAVGALNIYEACRQLKHKCKIYNAATSELFGNVAETPQTEKTPFYPRSPYAVAKLAAYWYGVNYREAYNMFICNGILHNHTSVRRGENFVEQKIVKGLCDVFFEDQKNVLILGNLDAKRDIGHAMDYVDGMWRMLQQDEPDDYLLATGKTYSVREMVDICVNYYSEKTGIYIPLVWEGDGLNEVGKDLATGRIIVRVNEKYFRPSEVEYLQGNAAKAKEKLGWEPTKYLPEILKEMIDYELENE